MLGAILKQYNSFPTSRIRPQSFNTRGHFFQGCISLGDPTILSSEIQTGAYNGKVYHKNSSGAREEKAKSKRNLHRSISQADLIMPRTKELHSS
jgi:hypothetical protein